MQKRRERDEAQCNLKLHRLWANKSLLLPPAPAVNVEQRFDVIMHSPETKMFHLLLSDVKHPVPNVVCGHLPVSVY